MNNHMIMQWQGNAMPFWPYDTYALLALSVSLAAGIRNIVFCKGFPRVVHGDSAPITGGGPPLERDR